MDFKSEQEAIEWVSKNIPIIIKSSNKRAKHQFISPYVSDNAFVVVTEYLGKELFKLTKS